MILWRNNRWLKENGEAARGTAFADAFSSGNKEEDGMFRRLVIAGALGAAAMYFLDPAYGVQRRANALNALDARVKQLNAALAGSGNRAIATQPSQAVATSADQGDRAAIDRLAAAGATTSSRAKTVKRASARTAKKTVPPA